MGAPAVSGLAASRARPAGVESTGSPPPTSVRSPCSTPPVTPAVVCASVTNSCVGPSTRSAAAPVRSFSVDAGASGAVAAIRASAPSAPSTATQRPGAANPAITRAKARRAAATPITCGTRRTDHRGVGERATVGAGDAASAARSDRSTTVAPAIAAPTISSAPTVRDAARTALRAAPAARGTARRARGARARARLGRRTRTRPDRSRARPRGPRSRGRRSRAPSR